MNTSKTKVAIIGLGNIGKAIATNLTKGEHPVLLASRELDKATVLATSLGQNAMATTIVDAIKNADVIIPAIYFDKIKEFLQTYANELQGKTIVDVSNPIAPDGNGGFKKIIDQDQSAGQILANLVPKNATLVKAFGTLGAASLANDAFSKPARKVLFYASDSINNNKSINELISDSGFVPFHIGGIAQAIRLEVFGDLYEFSKTITLEEAKNKI